MSDQPKTQRAVIFIIGGDHLSSIKDGILDKLREVMVQKHPEAHRAATEMLSRKEQGLCPFCGEDTEHLEMEDFGDTKTYREFQISGICPPCQTNFYDRSTPEFPDAFPTGRLTDTPTG